MSSMESKSIMNELKNINIAIELLEMGARTQVLESVTTLSRAKAVNLYKEITGESPPKGQLPFSADWFLVWRQNIHASLFNLIYRRYESSLTQGEALTKAYKRYIEIASDDSCADFNVTRAWTLIRFMESGILTTNNCETCTVPFIVHAGDHHDGYRCGICSPPARAGKRLSPPSLKVAGID